MWVVQHETGPQIEAADEETAASVAEGLALAGHKRVVYWELCDGEANA